ncbi:DUF393-domain-containing protein [Coccomyxa subellipsoidea C-169]|uniref:DUF393-domain-containing protein n=1 Tax=Coccomyxa subellipsoidea (strain C-169) TaxID=574566 RepID=I0YLY6_COCSC|nr:DUF393-domain-containing protein [Coccomyxa subellipsoidea C-169]EIE19405.1 DUF393-domain-containing protein [Coccomyxa subellipsoidea C-169]|eukprot:XP_005643949.1 DUF393-domain-containing protein [Coccomyxa subellipsoidea C-169]
MQAASSFSRPSGSVHCGPGSCRSQFTQKRPVLATRKTLSCTNRTAASSSASAPFATDKRPIILFDGVCNLCHGGVDFALKNDSKANLRFAALQSDTGKRLLQRCGRRPDDISSIVLVEQNACYIKSEAILRIAKRLSAPYPALAQVLFPLPGFFRDLVYDRIADSRYNIFGKKDMCQLTNEDYADRFVV